MADIVMFLAAASITLMFLGRAAAGKRGADVSARFLETSPTYTAATLQAWVNGSAARARGYAIPVLWPWDVLFLLSFGGFLVTAALSMASSRGWGALATFVSVLAPLLYTLTDIIEDVLLISMLTGAARISDRRVAITKRMTKVKVAASMVSLAEVLGLALYGVVSA